MVKPSLPSKKLRDFIKAASADINPKLILFGTQKYRYWSDWVEPAQRMFNRRMQTQVPTTIQLLQPTLFDEGSLKDGYKRDRRSIRVSMINTPRKWLPSNQATPYASNLLVLERVCGRKQRLLTRMVEIHLSSKSTGEDIGEAACIFEKPQVI